MIVGLGMVGLYISNQSSNSKLVSEIEFAVIPDASFGNGYSADQLWPSSTGVSVGEAGFAQIKSVKTFLFFAEWFHTEAITHPDAHYYMELPERAYNIKSYIVSHSNIDYPSPDHKLRGILIPPKKIEFEFFKGDTPSGIFFTGQSVKHALQNLGLIVIYSTSP